MICDKCIHKKVCTVQLYKAVETCERFRDKDDYTKVVSCAECEHNQANGGDCNRTLTITTRNYITESNETEYIKLDYCSYGIRKEK